MREGIVIRTIDGDGPDDQLVLVEYDDGEQVWFHSSDLIEVTDGPDS